MAGAPQEVNHDHMLSRGVEDLVPFSLRLPHQRHRTQPASTGSVLSAGVIASPHRMQRVACRGGFLTILERKRRAKEHVRELWQARIIELPTVLSALNDLTLPATALINKRCAIPTERTTLNPSGQRATVRLGRAKVKVGRH